MALPRIFRSIRCRIARCQFSFACLLTLVTMSTCVPVPSSSATPLHRRTADFQFATAVSISLITTSPITASLRSSQARQCFDHVKLQFHIWGCQKGILLAFPSIYAKCQTVSSHSPPSHPLPRPSAVGRITTPFCACPEDERRHRARAAPGRTAPGGGGVDGSATGVSRGEPPLRAK